jgi:hypothetical protein
MSKQFNVKSLEALASKNIKEARIERKANTKISKAKTIRAQATNQSPELANYFKQVRQSLINV